MTELLNTLYVQTPGTSLHLDGEAVRICHPDETRVRRLPLVRLDDIVLFGGVTISQELQLRCAADGRGVTWLSGYGRFRGRIVGPSHGGGLLRSAQHEHERDEARRLALAQAFVAGKIHNSRQLLLRAARDVSGERKVRLRETSEALAGCLGSLADARDTEVVFGIEGTAARTYFGAFNSMIAANTGMRFDGRNRRPPTDAPNCLMSFLYGMLRVAVQGAVEQVGLDPYVGYLHGLRPGKPSLALDLMEEFRPLLVDRLALTLVNRKEVTESDFEFLPSGAVRLTEEGRKQVMMAWQKSRSREWPHRLLKRDAPAGVLPLIQARLLARYLRGDVESYLPWEVR